MNLVLPSQSKHICRKRTVTIPHRMIPSTQQVPDRERSKDNWSVCCLPGRLWTCYSRTLATSVMRLVVQKRLEKPLDTQVPEGFERVSSSPDGCRGTFSPGPLHMSGPKETRSKAPLTFVLPGDTGSLLKQGNGQKLLAPRLTIPGTCVGMVTRRSQQSWEWDVQLQWALCRFVFIVRNPCYTLTRVYCRTAHLI